MDGEKGIENTCPGGLGIDLRKQDLIDETAAPLPVKSPFCIGSAHRRTPLINNAVTTEASLLFLFAPILISR
jgi:hypothetical protein